MPETPHGSHVSVITNHLELDFVDSSSDGSEEVLSSVADYHPARDGDKPIAKCLN